MRPFGKGRDRNRGRNYPTDESPLLENELQNLDMELEILKRQREIIFKQRQVENQLFSQRVNTFNQPSSSLGRSEPKQNYNNSYDTGFNSPGSSRGYKRAADRPFEHPSPKQSRINVWDSNFKPKPQPLMKVPTQFKKNAKPFPGKSKPFAGSPNQRDRPLQTKEIGNRETVKKSVVESKNQGYEVLRPGIEPSRSMRGRLELALGEILKKVRMSPQLTKEQKIRLAGPNARPVKDIIRYRINSIMMNRLVASKDDIVMHYRKSHPKDVDKEIIEALDTPDTLPNQTKAPRIRIRNISVEETERIHKFFKSKVNMLLRNKFQEMINNLSKIYGDNESDILECLKDLPELEKEDEPETDTQNGETGRNNTQGTDDTKETTEDVSNDVTEVEKEAEAETSRPVSESKEKDESGYNKLRQYYKVMNLLIENRLPKLLVKFKDEFAKVMYCEKDFIVAKEMITMELKDTLRQSLAAAQTTELAKPILTKNNDTDETVETSTAITEESNTSKQDRTEEPATVIAQGPNTPTDDGNNEAKSEKMDVDSNKINNVNKPSATAPETAQKSSQLFVMLLGRPALPAKSLIYDFINKFKPKSVKKHKTVNNLLVIGFENREDYENILKANESKVGDATFIIKANEVIASDKQKTTETSANEKDAEGAKDEVNEPTEDKTETEENGQKEPEVDNDEMGNNEEEKTEEVKEESVEDNKESVKQPITETIDGNSTETDNKESVKQPITETIDGNSTETDNKESVKQPITETIDGNTTETNDEIKDVIDDINEIIETENKVDDSKVIDGKVEDDNDGLETMKNKVSLETIQESDESLDKAKSRAAAVATPTRSSSRLANITPSTIRTRRASRLAQENRN